MVRFLLTPVVCDFCSARCSPQEKIVNNPSFLQFDCGYDCRKVLKHVAKSYDIFLLCATVVKMLYV